MRREDLNIVKDYNFEEGELFYRVERLNYTSEMEMSSISCVVAGIKISEHNYDFWLDFCVDSKVYGEFYTINACLAEVVYPIC